MDSPKSTLSSATRHGLPNVPEEPSIFNNAKTGPYTSTSAANSTSTLNSLSNPASSSSSRRATSAKTSSLGRSSNDHVSGPVASGSSSSSTMKRSTSASSTVVGASSSRSRHSGAGIQVPVPTTRFMSPKLPHDKDAELVPSAHMHWSKAPAWGTMPNRNLRALSATLVDTTIWIFGGCDDKDKAKDMYCFDIETMEWTRPEAVGDIPPPCRAHTATFYERQLIVFGGGLRSVYYDQVFVFDTQFRRWTKPHIAPGPRPHARRAHTAVFHKGKVWIFGGGTGLTALNDLWTLDVSGGAGTEEKPMKWEKIEPRSKKPGPRGYHTANLISNVMVVIGGSDGNTTFTDVWCLNLDTLIWTLVQETAEPPFPKRLAHTATQVGSFIFVMGGHNGLEYTSEMMLFNLVSLQYEKRTIHGKPPSPRGHHATVVADTRLFVIGGANTQVAFEDVYILDLAAAAYLPQVTNFRMNGDV